MRSIVAAVRAHRRRVREDEQGFFLVFFSLMLILMLACAGFVVDISNWELQGAKIQRAADAAALAGAVFLPDNIPAAQAAALEAAKSNGYTPGGSDNTVITATPVTGHPTQLSVTISQDVDSYFAQAVGITSKTVTKTGVGEYEKPVAMGSPASQYGNDPEPAGATTTNPFPGFWGSIAGSGTSKSNGDAYQANVCDSSTDGCVSGVNVDYDPNGYYYTVHFNQSATVDLQVFDPAFVLVGQNCPQSLGRPGGQDPNLPGAMTLSKMSGPGVGNNYVRGWPSSAGSAQPNTRYQYVGNDQNPNDAGYKWCTGDDDYGSGNKPSTTYTVYGPATVPGEPATAPQTSGCGTGWTFPGFSGDLKNGLTSNTKQPVSPTPQYLGAYFRQWFPICTGLSGTAGQDYFIRIKSGSGNARNSFSIRATSNAVSVSGNAKMSMYANVAGTPTNFYLARLLPNAAGHDLVLNFFDIGDGTNTTGSLQVLPPPDSNVGGAFAGCTFVRPGSSSPTTLSSCTITNVTQSVYNGKWVKVTIPIPSTYTCDMSTALGCWTKIKYSFNNVLHDVTSWNASVVGDPVRLVK